MYHSVPHEIRPAVIGFPVCLSLVWLSVHKADIVADNRKCCLFCVICCTNAEIQKQKKFRQEHQTELGLYEVAVKFLKEENPYGKIPSMKSLKSEKEKLTLQRAAQYETYKYFKEYQKELRTVCSNIDNILGQPHTLSSDCTQTMLFPNRKTGQYH